MVGTIIEYLKEYGDCPFTDMPMNDVDSLVLCQAAYLKFDGIVPGVGQKHVPVTLEDAARHGDSEKMFADVRYERENRALFEGMMSGRRYRSLQLCNYINVIEKEQEMQFSAVTFILEDGTVYVAFRGTDETIVGWKEDFNMTFLSPVLSQKYSVQYLDAMAEKLQDPFFVGGHSKGGNLAVYSAMNCKPWVQSRIRRIYNMDGPGFRPEVLGKCHYEEIAGKVMKILPHSSMVGMLFERDICYEVVESTTIGLAQHNPYTWKVEGRHFLKAWDIYESSRFMNNTLNEWILSLDKEQLHIFVDTLYQVISASRADDLIEFAADWKKSMNAMVAAMREVDDQTMGMLKEVVRSLFEIAGLRMKEEVGDRAAGMLRVGKRRSRRTKGTKSLLRTE